MEEPSCRVFRWRQTISTPEASPEGHRKEHPDLEML